MFSKLTGKLSSSVFQCLYPLVEMVPVLLLKTVTSSDLGVEGPGRTKGNVIHGFQDPTGRTYYCVVITTPVWKLDMDLIWS